MYDLWAFLNFGEYARLNFPEEWRLTGTTA
jgi:hypothetical protein